MANTKSEHGKPAANPKQLLILAALFAVLITVGVVQFSGLLGGGASPAPKPAAPSGNAPSQATQTAQTAENRLSLPPLEPRDPFRPVIAIARQGQEPSRATQREPNTRPPREITGTPPIAPMTLPPTGQLSLQPAENAPAPDPDQPQYAVTGVVQGPNSVAILVDKEGRRRFVKQGDLLEEGWRIVGIQRGAIALQKGKQRITVRVGESTAPNGGNTP
ncbi:MAG: hypothetical protein WHS44_12850 [Fimbriimonadales bacterium]|nr:MAG: hypothetical protein KatS3mg018_2311 [Fimbriimonadales bacterium]